MFRFSIGLLAGLVLLPAAVPPRQHDAAAIARTLDAANAAFSAAYVRGDAAAMAAMYTEDGVLLPPGRRLQGRAAIAQYFTPAGARKLLAHKLTAESRTISGDTVIEVGMYSSTSQTGSDPAVTRGERYLLVWTRKGDGPWQIQYDMWHVQR